MALSHQKPLYVVTKMNGISKELYEKYKAVAGQKRLKLLAHSRMPEPNGLRWLLVWDSRQDADAFCEAANEAGKASAWIVQELSPDDPAIQHRASVGLQARIKREDLVAVFRLEKDSLCDICTMFPDVIAAGDLTIPLLADEPLPEVEQLTEHFQTWTQLDEQQIKSLGGFRILNPVSRELIPVIV